MGAAKEVGKPDLKVIPGNFSAAGSSLIEAEAPKLLAKVSPRERKVFRYLVGALTDYGLVHRTDAVALLVIVRVFVQWLDAEEQLRAIAAANGGSMMVRTPNGYEQPHQLYYVAKDLKKQLLSWLPEAALTVPSFAKLTRDGDLPRTSDMFEDPLVAFTQRKKQLNGPAGG